MEIDVLKTSIFALEVSLLEQAFVLRALNYGKILGILPISIGVSIIILWYLLSC